MQKEGAAGFVLAGGQSRRMGQDKALLSFAGRPLIARAVNILQEACLDVAIAGERGDLAAYAPIVEDRVHAQGPLGGVCAALESVETRWAVFTTVDTPLLPPLLISYLLHHAQTAGSAVTVASIVGDAQTFPAVLDRAVLPLLRSELETGRLKCFSAFESAAKALGQTMTVVPVEMLTQTGEVTDPDGLAPAQWFLNVNTPDELRRAESLVRHPAGEDVGRG
jgi:molybdopterin-guanine dinucleotide biosynthesis protein A